MITFGVDVPLVEILFAIGLIMFVLLVELIIVVIILSRQMNETKKLSQLSKEMSEVLLQINQSQINELTKLRRR
jgi:Flp pilus assembly protein TadB